MLVNIGLLGDFNAGLRSHQATNEALRHSADALGLNVSANWLPTGMLAGEAAHDLLPRQDAIFAAPGCPFQSMQGVLNGIAFARREKVPFLGTCGGFQYALIEFARNVLGLADANTAENPEPSRDVVIAPVACPAANRPANGPRLSGTQRVRIQADSRLARIYNSLSAGEEYFCNYEVNAAYVSAFEASGVSFTAMGENGEVRAMEIVAHPFFLATLFQPQLGSVASAPHPIVNEFLRAAVSYWKASNATPPATREAPAQRLQVTSSFRMSLASAISNR